ncbi:methyl-accepting chemotaxis sensory transducer with Cache sensor [Ferrimonas sediminum]|uniref:Methyl-accepting chemotaxis sensory transducer with Cache sensor n=1 Tax=Ferrimonas sediminum TaxID=718193 RepID=A0A1G8UDW7_9GAMM|nr:methyl-accepting chemotaxis protein [Ferrimonas sediminum]SDJ52026.1 methyl-accepting chemotaxis sensory transducer with Cache sensor [Ferrimonas sediminum]
MKNISIRHKFSIVAGVCLIIALSAMVGFFLYDSGQTQTLIRQQTSDNLRQSARAHVGALASQQAQMVKSVIERHLFRGDILAQSLQFMRQQAQRRGVSDGSLRRDLKAFIAEQVALHPDVRGIYVVMNPDALDGSDAPFIGQSETASNEAGRFAPYWYRADGGELQLQIVDEAAIHNRQLNKQGVPENEWFDCPARTGELCVLNPYVDEVGAGGNLITSVTLPLKADGKVIGVMGIDLSLATLQPLIESVDAEFVDGSGEVALISQDGFIVACDGDASRLGESSQQLSDDLKFSLAATGSAIGWNRDDSQLYARVPVTFEGSTTSWTLVFSAPTQQVLASALSLDTQVDEHNRKAMWQMLLAAVVITVLALGLIWLASYYLVNPIWNVTKRLQVIASGEWDLTQRLVVESKDEVGVLVHWFNQFLEKLHSTVSLIDESVSNGQATSNRASAIAARTSGSSQQQFLEVEQVATALEQMTATANSVSENAAQAATAADDANDAAQQGRDVARHTSLAVQSLVGDVSAAMPMVEKLAQDSENIESILGVIQGIAEQTNLLALNAAIEAARAGDQGRGFAVVASEVRGLAERTQESIGQIRELIELLQSETRGVVLAISSGNDKALDAEKQVEAMNAALAVIVNHIGHISDNGAMIANLAAEQSSVANEISLNVANIREASRSITEEAESSAALSEELQQLSEQQRQIVTQFKV